jgi:hypothetical protein
MVCSWEPGEPAECRAWPGNPGSGVMNELGSYHDAAASCVRPTVPQLKSCLRNLCWSQPHQQIPARSNDGPPDQCPHFVNDISISARWWSLGALVTVRRYAAIFKSVEPLFDLSDPPLHHRRKPAEFCGLFPLWYVQVSDKTWCNIAALNVLSSRAKRECDEHVLHHFSIWHRQTHPKASRGSKKSHMHMKVPSTTTLSFPTLSPLLTAGKNTVGYFLERRYNRQLTRRLVDGSFASI